jgi:hypothetical protein
LLTVSVSQETVSFTRHAPMQVVLAVLHAYRRGIQDSTEARVIYHILPFDKDDYAMKLIPIIRAKDGTKRKKAAVTK